MCEPNECATAKVLTDQELLTLALVQLQFTPSFGISAIQRNLQLSYGNAFRIADRGLTLGLLTRPYESYLLSLTDKGRRLAQQHSG
ncbi:hypothetical protein [Motilimonas eburnea]|uniref:hypothetical protein n=1 Tax=Motilimonas eburnea TaxID=1737488 RepID=UPI001E41A66B|nr:hypothetical protein [Motilimonas eburnea]MCE2571844.1 hypothetical protein [Motilimonas eburnea]